ncbi:unnamed protein product, partial [Candidula unifasciata]
MERLSHVSFGLCSSCVSTISRNMQSICLRQTGVYFSTNTQLLKSPVSRSLDMLRFVSGLQLKYPARQRVGELSMNLKNSDLLGIPLLKLNTPVFSAQLYSTSTSTPDPQKPSPKTARLSAEKLISWKSVLLLASVGVLIVLAVQLLKAQKELERKKARSRTLGKAKLGGDWTLTDHNGNRRSSTDFRGQWLLIYFGFTHCPDVCPEELEKIVSVIKKTDADEKLPKIQPIIISVDPERDTPQALKEYCSEFSPRLLGFTGSPEEVQQATHAYRVYFSAGPKDDDNDYI